MSDVATDNTGLANWCVAFSIFYKQKYVANNYELRNVGGAQGANSEYT